MRGVRDLFHNADLMELVIATIPTMLGMNESARLASQLRKEGVPCKRIVVNQVSTVVKPLKSLTWTLASP